MACQCCSDKETLVESDSERIVVSHLVAVPQLDVHTAISKVFGSLRSKTLEWVLLFHPDCDEISTLGISWGFCVETRVN